jgi:outer membrane protein TolC
MRERSAKENGMMMTFRTAVALMILSSGWVPLGAQQPIGDEPVIELTLERMVELAMSNSYQIRRVNLDIERTRYNLQAQRAGLKSRVDLNLQTPTYETVSEARWNSLLGRNEIARENSSRWQADLSIRQPVILFGYPTNGELSLNSRLYRYRQIDGEGEVDVRYYNRYFVAYEQRLFQPNQLRNNLEEAELNLESSELNFQQDVVGLIDNVADDYYELFENAYDDLIYQEYVDHLGDAIAAGDALAAADPARAVDLDQIRIELANAQEDLQAARSDFRLSSAEVRQDFRLPPNAILTLDPVISIAPVEVPLVRAVALARTLTPRLRQLDIDYREREINLDQTRGQQAFRMDLELTYGREMQNSFLDDLFREPTNSYSIGVNAYVPIWDWGQRQNRIAAQEINLEQTRLQIEQTETDIESNVNNEVRNLAEFESRALAMQDNRTLAHQASVTAMERYQAGAITASELLQSLEREVSTNRNFLDAFLGWRGALLRLQQLTYYDFERDLPVLERFGIGADGSPLALP